MSPKLLNKKYFIATSFFIFYHFGIFLNLFCYHSSGFVCIKTFLSNPNYIEKINSKWRDYLNNFFSFLLLGNIKQSL